MPKKKAKPKAERIRAMLDAGAPPTEVRRKLRTSRQAVFAADARRKPNGRPSDTRKRRRVALYLAPETYDWLRAESARDGCTLGEVIDGARLALIAADAGDDPALAAHVIKRKDGAA